MAWDFPEDNGVQVNLGDAPSYPFTLAAWARYDTDGERHGVVFFARLGVGAPINTWAGIQIASEAVNDPVYGWVANLPTGFDFLSGGSTSLNTWHHVAFTGDSASGTLRLYLDGTEVATDSSPTAFPGGMNRFQVGALKQQGISLETPMHGRIDWPCYWSAELSADEIIALSEGVVPTLVKPENLGRFAPSYGGDFYDVLTRAEYAEIDELAGTVSKGDADHPMILDHYYWTPLLLEIAGSGTSEVADVESAGVGEEEFEGSGTAATSGGAVVEGAGEEEMAGSGTVPTTPAVALGGGEEEMAGSGTCPIGTVEVEGAGEESLSGSGTVSTPVVDVEGAGEEVFEGSGTVPLGSPTVEGAGEERFQGFGAAQISTVQVVGLGEEAILGAGVAIAPGVIVESVGGVLEIAGGGAAVAPIVVVSGAGLHDPGGPVTLVPVLNFNLDVLGVDASVEVAGAASLEVSDVDASVEVSSTVGSVTIAGAGDLEVASTDAPLEVEADL